MYPCYRQIDERSTVLQNYFGKLSKNVRECENPLDGGLWWVVVGRWWVVVGRWWVVVGRWRVVVGRWRVHKKTPVVAGVWWVGWLISRQPLRRPVWDKCGPTRSRRSLRYTEQFRGQRAL